METPPSPPLIAQPQPAVDAPVVQRDVEVEVPHPYNTPLIAPPAPIQAPLFVQYPQQAPIIRDLDDWHSMDTAGSDHDSSHDSNHESASDNSASDNDSDNESDTYPPGYYTLLNTLSKKWEVIKLTHKITN